jgi:hypothetical protein
VAEIDTLRALTTWRTIAQVAIHELHAAHLETERLTRLVTEMREERTRYARELFRRTPADE